MTVAWTSSRAALAALAAQAQGAPAFIARLAKKTVVLDPMLDAATGQQTAATTLLETRVGERLATKGDAFEIVPFQSASLARAATPHGTMTRVEGEAAKRNKLRIQLALTDLKAGTVVAQASALARDEGLDPRRTRTTATARCS
jgi:hypothetical protein